MKKIIFILSIFFGLLPIILSCKKSPANKQNTQTINVTLKPNQSYQFDLGGFGIEEGAGITKQATHFLISTATRDISGNTPNIIYTYVSAKDYVGTDEVELKSERGSNGASPNMIITYTIIKFQIKN